ncbi:hypothetical protein ABIB26_001816 [Arthrobacter sp. UYEF20]
MAVLMPEGIRAMTFESAGVPADFKNTTSYLAEEK